ncbi:MAG: universal stress protein, partial [Bacteroidia bacterium]
ITFDIKRILVPVDFSETSMEALNHAIYLAKITKASITMINVTETVQPVVVPVDYPIAYSYNIETFEKAAITHSKQHLKKLTDKIKKKDNISISFVATIGWVKDEIIETAKRIKADIIIMGTHGVKGFREFIMGSNTFRVVNESQCPVLSIQKHTSEIGFTNILVPFRDKPHSREKVDYAIRMAEIYGASIIVLGIDTDGDKGQFNKIVKEAEQIKKIVEKHNVPCKIKVRSSGYLADEVLKYAGKKNVDLIVAMADLDRMRVSEYFMGPFSQQIVNHSSIPILSIRPSFNPETIDLHGYGW